MQCTKIFDFILQGEWLIVNVLRNWLSFRTEVRNLVKVSTLVYEIFHYVEDDSTFIQIYKYQVINH